MCEFPAWLCDWPGPVVFLAAVLFLSIAGALLGAWDRWRARRMWRGPHKPLWRRIRGKISY
jgi:hypothetical protein